MTKILVAGELNADLVMTGLPSLPVLGQELIGDGPNQLVPHYRSGEEELVYEAHRRKNKGGEHQKRTGKAAANQAVNRQQAGKKMLTQHTGLPPKAGLDKKRKAPRKGK